MFRALHLAMPGVDARDSAPALQCSVSHAHPRHPSAGGLPGPSWKMRSCALMVLPCQGARVQSPFERRLLLRPTCRTVPSQTCRRALSQIRKQTMRELTGALSVLRGAEKLVQVVSMPPGAPRLARQTAAPAVRPSQVCRPGAGASGAATLRAPARRWRL